MPSEIRICEASVDTRVEFIEAAADDGGGTDSPKSFKMTAYTGGEMLLAGWPYPVVIDLAGLKVSAKSRPILRDHEPSKIVGHTDAITIDAKSVKVSGVISAANEHAAEVVAAAANGFPWQASVGARSTRGQFVDEGEKVSVNGRSFTGPLLVARRSILKEISFLALGADDNTTARIAAESASNSVGVYSMNFEKWVEAKGFTLDDLNDAQRGTLQAAYDAEIAAGDGDGDGDGDNNSTPATITAAGGDGASTVSVIDLKAQRQLQADEINRSNAIRAACTQHETDHGERAKFDVQGKAIDVEAHAIVEGWTTDRTELELLRASRPSAPAGHAHSHDTDCTLQAMQCASLLRAGMALDHKSFSTVKAVAIGIPSFLRAGINDDNRQRAMEAAHRFSDMALLDIARESIRLDCAQIPGGRSEIIHAAFSGSSMTNIFNTNVNASVLASYMEVGDTTDGWVSVQDVADFRTNDRMRVLTGGNLKKLPRGKPADHRDYSDTQESYKIARYAGMFQIDEQDMIDDRFDVFTIEPQKMGVASGRLRPDLVYSILMANANLADSVALFDATHNNLNTSAALTAANLKVAISALITQQENGVNLNLQPTHLIVPSTLEFTADELMNSTQIIITGNTDAERGNRNTIAARHPLSVVADPRLENGVTDPDSETVHAGSSSTWFLLSSMGHNIEVGYRRGSGRVPQVRQFALDKGLWGLGWDVNMDIGAMALDFNGMQKSTA